jgi:hypothetical protein
VDFKVVVLVEVDKLSRQAQAALRRTMEKYSTSCRLILCCNNQSKVIDPVRSRCLGIRIAAPTHDDVRLLHGIFSLSHFISFSRLTKPSCYYHLFPLIFHVFLFNLDMSSVEGNRSERKYYFAG